MAKLLLVAICLVGILATGHAAPEGFTRYNAGRKLLQALTCDLLENALLRANSCNQLERCILYYRPQLNQWYYVTMFRGTCSDCVRELGNGQCRGSSVPNSCAQGFKVEVIAYCLRRQGG